MTAARPPGVCPHARASGRDTPRSGPPPAGVSHSFAFSSLWGYQTSVFLPSAKCPESLELRCVRNLIVGTGATRVPAGAPVCIPGFSQAPSRQLSAALEQGFLSCLASLSSCPQWSKRLVKMTFSSAARSHGSVPREAVCLRPSR